MSFRDRAGSEPVTAEANRLNSWAAAIPTEDLVAWEAELRGLEHEVKALRLELAHTGQLDRQRSRASIIRLRELALRAADMRSARWGD